MGLQEAATFFGFFVEGVWVDTGFGWYPMLTGFLGEVGEVEGIKFWSGGVVWPV